MSIAPSGAQPESTRRGAGLLASCYRRCYRPPQPTDRTIRNWAKAKSFQTALERARDRAARQLAGEAAMASASTSGTWFQYPAGGTEYQADVQQPINSANTSNWSSKSKGAIPVMFKLSSREAPAVFESIGSDASTANDFAYLSFAPDTAITFNDLTELSSVYSFTLADEIDRYR